MRGGGREYRREYDRLSRFVASSNSLAKRTKPFVTLFKNKAQRMRD